MKNPAAVSQPRLNPPIGRRGSKGNLPYLRVRRRVRKNLLRF